MNSQELRNLQEAYLEVYQNQNISEEPIQDYRDRRRAAENKSGLRGPELSNSGSSKGTPKPGSASVSTTGPSSPGYDTRRLGGSDLRRLSTPSPTLQSKGTYKPGSASVSKPVRSREFAREDMFDLVKGHLLDEGYADTEEAAIAIMANMSEEWRESIISEAPGEWFGGLRDRARASRAAQIQSMQPTPKPGPNVSSPFAKPASRNDSGRLTTYGAGGGAAAERAGKTRSQVMKQGATNLETRNKSNPGPNFGR